MQLPIVSLMNSILLPVISHLDQFLIRRNLVRQFIALAHTRYLALISIVAVIVDVYYCKTINICSIKFSRFTKNDILAHINFGVHDSRK